MPVLANSLKPYGAVGLKQASGYSYEEWDVEMSGDLGRRNIREMLDSTPVFGAALQAYKLLFEGVHWQVTPANDSSEARKVADFVDECRNDLDVSWEEFVGGLSQLPWGWDWREIEFKLREGPQDWLSYELAASQGTAATQPPPSSAYNDGRIGWKAFSERSQESLLHWKWNDEGSELLGMWQIPAPTYRLKFVPTSRSMNFRTTTVKNNPEGRSLLRNCRVAYKFMKGIMIHEGIGVERDLTGLPSIGVPPELLAPNPTADDAAALAMWKQIARDIRNDEQGGIIYPLDYDLDTKLPRFKIELLASPGQKSFDTDKIISRHEQRMLMVLLADFLMIGHEGVGSRALVDPRMDMFALSAESYLRTVASVINSRAVPLLMTMNRIPLELAPKITPGRVRMTSLLNMAKYILALQQAMQAGPLPADALERLYENADLPTADLGATLKSQQVNTPSDQQAGKVQQPGADTNGDRAQPEPAETPQEPANAASYPETWPDAAFHAFDDQIGKRPSDIHPRQWSEMVLESVESEVRREKAKGRRIFA